MFTRFWPNVHSESMFLESEIKLFYQLLISFCNGGIKHIIAGSGRRRTRHCVGYPSRPENILSCDTEEAGGRPFRTSDDHICAPSTTFARSLGKRLVDDGAAVTVWKMGLQKFLIHGSRRFLDSRPMVSLGHGRRNQSPPYPFHVRPLDLERIGMVWENLGGCHRRGLKMLNATNEVSSLLLLQWKSVCCTMNGGNSW